MDNILVIGKGENKNQCCDCKYDKFCKLSVNYHNLCTELKQKMESEPVEPFNIKITCANYSQVKIDIPSFMKTETKNKCTKETSQNITGKIGYILGSLAAGCLGLTTLITLAIFCYKFLIWIF